MLGCIAILVQKVARLAVLCMRRREERAAGSAAAGALGGRQPPQRAPWVHCAEAGQEHGHAASPVIAQPKLAGVAPA